MKFRAGISATATMLAALALAQLSACGGGGGGGGDPTLQPNYTITGTVTSSTTAKVQGVTITLSGAASGTTTTDANGTFTFTGLPFGDYTLTPSKAGYGFNPATSSVTVARSHTGNVISFGGDPMWDVDAQGIPKFVGSVYIDLTQTRADGVTPLVSYISYFRSSAGHDYSDSYESCRSMKHYLTGVDANTLLYAPVSGTVVAYDGGTPAMGGNIKIESDQYPAFTFTIMHSVLNSGFKIGDHVTEHQLLGHHVGTQTASDIIVSVYDGTNTPKTSGSGPDGRLVSYFATLTDATFQTYINRNHGFANGPADLVITRAQRDATPVHCLANGMFDPAWTDPLRQGTSF
jgi:uncharacterized surface anchored protein